MSDERRSESAGRRFMRGGLPAVITGRSSRHRARNGAIAGFVGAAGVGIIENVTGFLPALAIMTVVVIAVVSVLSFASRSSEHRD